MLFSRRNSVISLQKFDSPSFSPVFDPKTGFKLVVRSGVSGSPTLRLQNPPWLAGPGVSHGPKASVKKPTRG